MPTLFTRIINGEIPSYRIAEDSDYFAFLDINPLVKGHALVTPKKEIDYIFDLPKDTLEGLMIFSQKVAQAIESVVDCERIGVAVIGLEIPHAHVHLIPINQVGDMNFNKERVKLSEEEFMDLANRIQTAFNN